MSVFAKKPLIRVLPSFLPTKSSTTAGGSPGLGRPTVVLEPLCWHLSHAVSIDGDWHAHNSTAQAAPAANHRRATPRTLLANPVPLNLKGKNRALVGLGSYIVNTGGCNDCHTNPSYVVGGDPFMGEPEQINTAGFLAGGQHFGPFASANLHA